MKKILSILLLTTSLSFAQQVDQYSTATTGNTITIQDSQQNVQLIHDAAVSVAVLTINMPANPFNGMIVGISSANGIVALTMSAGLLSITNPVTSMIGTLPVRYKYISATNKWYRI